MLSDLLCDVIPDFKERQTAIDRLNALADDVDKILRDDQFSLGNLLDDTESEHRRQLMFERVAIHLDCGPLHTLER